MSKLMARVVENHKPALEKVQMCLTLWDIEKKLGSHQLQGR